MPNCHVFFPGRARVTEHGEDVTATSWRVIVRCARPQVNLEGQCPFWKAEKPACEAMAQSAAS